MQFEKEEKKRRNKMEQCECTKCDEEIEEENDDLGKELQDAFKFLEPKEADDSSQPTNYESKNVHPHFKIRDYVK